MSEWKLTSKQRLSPRLTSGGCEVLALQVQEHRFVPEYSGSHISCADEYRWRDAKVEDVTVGVYAE